MTKFRHSVEKAYSTKLDNYQQLHQWSVEHSDLFWGALADFLEVRFDHRATSVLEHGDDMRAARWFSGSKLNFAENLLRYCDTQPDKEAIVSCTETGYRATITFGELYQRVHGLVTYLRQNGVTKGDRVAAYLPNQIETIIAMLATTAIGAIWSSCSPDFGVSSVLARFSQIEPKVLFASTGYYYNGKHIDTRPNVSKIASAINSIRKVIVVDFPGEPAQAPQDAQIHWKEATQPTAGKIQFEQLPFDAPALILYSSGTTGKPKAIVHGAGGTLLQHLKEHALHINTTPADRVFYFTTCGWMMWNWLVSALGLGATVVLYEGAPFHHNGNTMWEMAERERVTVFGTSAAYITHTSKMGLTPFAGRDLSALRAVLSTGSPLSAEGFEFVYSKIKADICLASICGGTDIISSFLIGNPTLPVYAGQIQCVGLGHDIAFVDGQGNPLFNEYGELTCRRPFPSMPVAFWDDPDGSKYYNAYFGKLDGVWCHGDYGKITPQGGVIIQGRSDAVLNPGGVRIGTAEIYQELEKIEQIADSVVVDQEWEGDRRVVLFVTLKPQFKLDDELITTIRRQIRANASPRHVPAVVKAVPDVPRTLTGKKAELAVKAILHNQPVTNKSALANPECLQHFNL